VRCCCEALETPEFWSSRRKPVRGRLWFNDGWGGWGGCQAIRVA
jgi:hypothetical protein